MSRELMHRRALLFGIGCVATASSAVAFKPTRRSSQVLKTIELEKQVPKTFGVWALDAKTVPLLPNPALLAELEKIYGQVLARTYVRRDNQRVMLSIAYGEDQGTDATAAHRPEFCYTAQGFSVSNIGERSITVDGRTFLARRLLARLETRYEPITYWVTLNEEVSLPGVRRKIQQIRLGLLGQIPDGLLVRTSTVGLPLESSLQIQDEFLLALSRAIDPTLVPRFFGR